MNENLSIPVSNLHFALMCSVDIQQAMIQIGNSVRAIQSTIFLYLQYVNIYLYLRYHQNLYWSFIWISSGWNIYYKCSRRWYFMLRFFPRSSPASGKFEMEISFLSLLYQTVTFNVHFNCMYKRMLLNWSPSVLCEWKIVSQIKRF